MENQTSIGTAEELNSTPTLYISSGGNNMPTMSSVQSNNADDSEKTMQAIDAPTSDAPVPRVNTHGQVKTSRNISRPKLPLPPLKKKKYTGPLHRSSWQQQIKEKEV